VEANVPPQSTLNSKNPQARAKYQQNSRQISPHDPGVGRRNIPVETQHKGREIGRKDKTELRADHEEGSMVEQQLPVPSCKGVEELGRDLSHTSACGPAGSADGVLVYPPGPIGATEPAPGINAEKVTTENITPEIVTPENKEALEEFLRQIAGLAATALAATVGGEVQLHLAASAAPSWSSDAIVCFQTRNEAEAGAPLSVELQISPALAAELQLRAQGAAAAQIPAHASPPSSLPAPSSSYRRLMDVGLDVKLRFGTRRMLLRDVLALSAGVVVELDNALHSPVDLLLDGRLIAQGEVVIVDGKYGLRITDVVDPAPALGSPV